MSHVTLKDATRRYKLKDPNIDNNEICDILGTEHWDNDACASSPCCFFNRIGTLVSIRTERDEIAVFHVFPDTQAVMEKIGDRIP